MGFPFTGRRSLSSRSPDAPGPSSPGPSTKDKRLKGVAEAAEVVPSEDEDTCPGLVFRRKRKADAIVPAQSGFDGQSPSYRECPHSASSPRNIIMQEGGGESALGVTMVTPLLICQPPSSKRCNPFDPRRGWRTWRMTPYWSTC